jgi:subtilisin family serine protease
MVPRFVFLFALAAAVLGPAPTADAQSAPGATDERIELIVRPAPAGPGDLRATLRRSADGAALPASFEGVTDVRALLRPRPAESSGQAGGRARRGASRPTAFALTVSDSTALEAALDRWRGRSDVAYVQKNVRYRLHGAPSRRGNREGARRAPAVRTALSRRLSSLKGLVNRSGPPTNLFADSLDHLDVVRARSAWDVTRGRSDVTIGILDTGLYLDHPDLASSIAINPAEDVNGNGRVDPADFDGTDADGNGYVDDVAGYDFVDRSYYLPGEYDDRDPDATPDPEGPFSGHATLVAGAAAARAADTTRGIYGVAPDVSLMPLRAFAGDGRGETDDIAAAIVYAADQDVDVLNLSFGRPRPSPLVRDAIDYAVAQGTVVVASAGNNSTDEPHYPSDYPNVLSVVWLAEDGEGLPTFSRSQFGIGVDIGAPGSDVYTTQYPRSALNAGDEPELDDLYGPASGSSFAAPQVAGAAALLRSVEPSLSPAAVRSILTSTAADLADENWDHTTGAGRVDVLQALGDRLPARTEISRPPHNAGTAATGAIPVVGSAVDPGFVSYALSYAEGTQNLDERADPWQTIRAATERQVLRDTLGTWNVGDLQEGAYTLRLVTTLQNGSTVEDRRRVVVDRSAPTLDLETLVSGMIDGRPGVIAEAVTDDAARVTMDVAVGGRTATVESGFRARRHALTWPDERGTGGQAAVTVEAVNRSGLRTTVDTSLALLPNRINPAYLRRSKTDVPRGRLLPQTVDFDRDGLRELVFNQTDNLGISDTLRSFEWAGSGFAPQDTLVADVIPRDVGDTEGDGLQELLTQVAGVTLLLEQPSPQAFPVAQEFLDTTGLESPDSSQTLIGTLLTDLDDDGRGEIVGNNQRQWRVLERRDTTFREVYRLENPTSAQTVDTLQNANRFGTAAALDGDFDADGRTDLLVGDRDGDWIMYESTGDDAAEPVWTYETDAVDAGSRFGAGDVDGDGEPEFVTFSTYYQLPLEGGDFQAPISTYYVWDATGDDAYEPVFRLPLAGEASGSGGIATADLDGDGRDEVVVTYPPSLYVLDRSGGEWAVVYHDDRDPSALGPSLVAEDVDGNGIADLLVPTTGPTLARYVPAEQGIAEPPPRWVEARPTGSTTSRLEWRAPGADSVTVFAALPGEALDRRTATSDSALVVDGASTRQFGLRAWRGGEASPLSPPRTVRPHSPARVASVTHPDSNTVRLRFSEPLSSRTRAEQFRFRGKAADRLLLSEEGRAALLRFDAIGEVREGELQWRRVRDRSGLDVGQTSVAVSFPSPEPAFYVQTATVLDGRRVRLTFNRPVDPASVREAGRYEVAPTGRVSDVAFDPQSPSTATLTIAGILIGASATEARLTIAGLRSADGARISDEGRSVRLTRPSDGLDEVVIYPNPYRAQRHAGVTIAGLPRTATVRIFSPDGRLVRTLEAQRNGSGGLTWDARDRRGDAVPSGVYLVRVEADGNEAVLKKAAVIR